MQDARDSIRIQLHDVDQLKFPLLGQVGTSVGSVASELLQTQNLLASSQIVCTNCEYQGPIKRSRRLRYIINPAQSKIIPASTSKLVKTLGHSMSRSEEHTSELQSLTNLVCRLLLEKK